MRLGARLPKGFDVWNDRVGEAGPEQYWANRGAGAPHEALLQLELSGFASQIRRQSSKLDAGA